MTDITLKEGEVAIILSLDEDGDIEFSVAAGPNDEVAADDLMSLATCYKGMLGFIRSDPNDIVRMAEHFKSTCMLESKLEGDVSLLDRETQGNA